MTQQQVDKTVIWVLSGVCTVMLGMVAYFLVRIDGTIDANFKDLNARVDIMQDSQIEMKSDIKYIKFDTLRLQNDVEDLKKNIEH